MSCCVELVVAQERTPVVLLDAPVALVGAARSTDVTLVVERTPVLLLDHPTPVIGAGGVVQQGGGDGGGNMTEVYKVLFDNDGDVVVLNDGRIATGRV